jgi:hypothetical protein
MPAAYVGMRGRDASAADGARGYRRGVTSPPQWPLRLAIGISAFEAVALVAYAMAIGVAGRNSRGSTVTATGVEIVIYLVFAALIALVCFGLVRRNSLARTPYLIVEVFVGIVGWTVLSGDGTWTKATGAAILLLGVVGVVSSLMPGLMRLLEPEDDVEGRARRT